MKKLINAVDDAVKESLAGFARRIPTSFASAKRRPLCCAVTSSKARSR